MARLKIKRLCWQVQESVPVRKFVEQYLHDCTEAPFGPAYGFRNMSMWLDGLVENGAINANDLKVLFPNVDEIEK